MRFVMVVLSFSLLVPVALGQEVAPLTDPDKIFWAHAPFEMGECVICHESNDPQAPGAVTGEINDLCFSCHDLFQEMLAEYPNVHHPVEESCTSCHNPHNSSREKLLDRDPADLCGGCHEEILALARDSAVQHDPVLQGRACLNCHDAHASRVEAMLTGLPYDLCVECHGRDGMTDESGRPLTNFRTLISGSHMEHGPVADKDCSACHHTHGGSNFRMLLSEYPEKFYASYDAANYDLCFSCHEIDVFETPETTTLTGFRDGARNLHHLHVNKIRRGRTCRACHEVHAAPQEHMIRDGVPYGPNNWILEINFTGAPNGGSCAKTCHPTKPYERTAVR